MNAKPTTPDTPQSRGASVHVRRTMMLGDLQTLLTRTEAGLIEIDSLKDAVIEENILGKRTERTRTQSWRSLKSAYRLEHADLVSSGFLQVWHAAPEAQAQLALLRLLPTDHLLQLSAEWVVRLTENEAAKTPALAAFLQSKDVKYNDKTLRSISQNLLSSWMQVGWLSGKAVKKRTAVNWQPAAIVFLLFQEYRRGGRGLGLYESDTARMLGLTPEQLDVLASDAGQRGHLNYKRIDDVLEITFPGKLGDDV